MRLGRIAGIIITLMIIVSAFQLKAQENGGTHIVQNGENLFRIALRYGIDLNQLAATNGIADPRTIFVGQSLVIPGLSAPDAGDVVENPLVATAPVIHTIQRGEFLNQIAELYDVSVEQILQANSLVDPDTVYPGQELQIWTSGVSSNIDITQSTGIVAEPEIEEVETSEESRTETAAPLTHIVQAGEYLSQIARRYNVNWTEIAEANNIVDPNNIYAGLTLTIPGGNPEAAQAQPAPRRALDLADIQGPGAHWGHGRELVVDLSSQMAFAYDNGELQYSAIVSTGLPATPTVQGEFAIWHKTPAQTMSGPGYSLPNVQWVMYFFQGYGFHGTYWHDNFGQPMSHGCVNMTNDDARWFYDFASLGTPVWVQV